MFDLPVMGKGHGKGVTLQTDKHRFLELPWPMAGSLKCIHFGYFSQFFLLFDKFSKLENVFDDFCQKNFVHLRDNKSLL